MLSKEYRFLSQQQHGCLEPLFTQPEWTENWQKITGENHWGQEKEPLPVCPKPQWIPSRSPSFFPLPKEMLL